MGMTSQNTFSACIKALACLIFAVALVLLPPSSAHAASGMHDDPQVAAIAEHAHTDHAHDTEASQVKCGVVSDSAGGDHNSGQCCSGICLSVALNEVDGVFFRQKTRDTFLAFFAQIRSIDPTGFLRPPQHLI
jgi:hypothetical protein